MIRIGVNWHRMGSRASLLVLLGVLLGALGCEPYADAKAGLAPADRERFDRGRRLVTPCRSCHDLVGRGNGVGPYLTGLIGRRVGSAEGYTYSRALANSTLLWNASRLDAFLADSQGFLPGTRMVSPDLTDPGRRRDLVFFLDRVLRSRPDGD